MADRVLVEVRVEDQFVEHPARQVRVDEARLHPVDVHLFPVIGFDPTVRDHKPGAVRHKPYLVRAKPGRREAAEARVGFGIPDPDMARASNDLLLGGEQRRSILGVNAVPVEMTVRWRFEMAQDDACCAVDHKRETSGATRETDRFCPRRVPASRMAACGQWDRECFASVRVDPVDRVGSVGFPGCRDVGRRADRRPSQSRRTGGCDQPAQKRASVRHVSLRPTN